MEDFIRTSVADQLIRFSTGNRVLQYPGEKSDFTCPKCYGETTPDKRDPNKERDDSLSRQAEVTTGDGIIPRTSASNQRETPLDSIAPPEDAIPRRSSSASSTVLSRIPTIAETEKSSTRADLETLYSIAARADEVRAAPSRVIEPEKTLDGIILVDWYTTKDLENPQNWSSTKRAMAALQIYLYTLAVHMSSSIYTPSVSAVESKFGVSPTAASLGLALYVLGYGTGPLIFAPISQIPLFGRNRPYIITFGLFVVLSIPSAVVDNFGGLLVLRFLQGFFGSLCFATGAATIGDMYGLLKLPYALTVWAAFATLGPALGPVISGFSVPAIN